MSEITSVEILEQMRDQPFQMPDLWSLLGYRAIVNPNGSGLIDDFARIASSILQESEQLETFKKIDFVLMGSSFFPDAHREELASLVFCSMWLLLLAAHLKGSAKELKTQYLEITHPSFVEGCSRVRQEILDFVRTSLYTNNEPDYPINAYSITWLFQYISSALKNYSAREQLDLFVKQLDSYMRQSMAEMEINVEQHIPTRAEYRSVREGAHGAGIGVLLSLVFYSYRLRVPRQIDEVPLVKQLWDETTRIVSLTNDLHSFEIDTSHEYRFRVMNIVVVYYKELGCISVQAAIDEVLNDLFESRNRFYRLALELKDQHNQHSMSEFETRITIRGCESIWAGNYHWLVEPDREESL